MARRSGRATATPATAALTAAGIPFERLAYAHDARSESFGEEAARELGVEPERVFKTLIVTSDAGPACVVIPVPRRLSPRAAGAALSTKGVALADPALAERRTGYVIGGISPLGQRTSLVTLIDESALRFETILVSGGRRGLDLVLDPTDLARAAGATFAPLTSDGR